MTNDRSTRSFLLVLALGATSGCTDGRPASIDAHEARATVAGNSAAEASLAPVSALSDDAANGAVGGAGWIAIPRQWQLPKVSKIKSAASWDARIARLPESDQAWLRELDDRYAGALAFSSPEEQQWLVRQGFPMPEEWLAKSGNRKAQMLFVDRIGSQIASIRTSGRGLGTSPEDRELFKRYTAATVMADELLRETKSPFAAYLRGQIFRSGSQNTPPEYLASGIMMAQQLGDGRASDIQRAFLRKYPDMNAGALMSANSSMQSALTMGKPSGP